MSAEGIKHKILLILITLTIIGEALSIIMWTLQPELQLISLLNYELGVISAGVMIVLNLFALYWIIKGKTWAPLYFIALSIGNRLWSQTHFDGGVHMIFVTWTSLLVIFAFNEYRGLSNSETGILSGGVILNLVLSSFLFNPVDSLTYGLVFYLLFLVGLVTFIIVLRKLRKS
jgi:hypothetical protein